MKKLIHCLFPDKNLSRLPKTSINRPIYVLDIGARGGLGWPWKNAQKSDIHAILLEPDPQEAKRLAQNSQSTVIPHALWYKNEQIVLNINNSAGTSSVFPANMNFLNQFDNAERFLVDHQIKLEAKTIDSLIKDGRISEVDFAKIDVQGAELSILQGGQNYLKNNLVGLEVEVEFNKLYQGQPLFSDIEPFIRQQLGLELWDIRKTYWKYKQKDYKNPIKGQLIFGDALFLRPLSKLDNWLSNMGEQIAKEKLYMLVVTTIAYGYLDYADTLLNTVLSEQYLTSEDKLIFSQYINRLHKSFYPFKNGSSLLYHPLQVLANCFKPTYQGWASTDNQHLGSRKKGYFWF